MSVIRVAGIAAACAVHGILLLDSSLSQAVDLNSGAISASQFSLSINYQSAAASNEVSPKAEMVETTPLDEAKPESVIEETVSANEVVNKDVDKPHAEISEKIIKNTPSDQAVTQPVNDISQDISKQEVLEKPLAKPVDNKPLVKPEDEMVVVSEEPDKSAAAAPLKNYAQGIHEAVIAKPLFAAPPEPPSYPKLARKRGQQGTVWVEVLLGETGQQLRTEIHQTSGVSLLDRAALTVVQKWQFIAHRINGVAVVSRIRIPVEFSLD